MAFPANRLSRPSLGKVVLRSTTSPLNLGVAAGSAVVAVGLTSWAVGALGAITYVALIAYDAFNPTFWQKVQQGSSALRPTLPAAQSVKDPSTREAVSQLRQAHQQIAHILAETPDQVKEQLGMTLASLSSLDGHAVRLIAQAEDIAAHLASVNLGALRAEEKSLGIRAAQSRDAQAKANFASAQATRQEELRALEELITVKDRVDGNLLRLVAVLTSLPTRIVHMRALDAEAVGRLTGDIHEELEAVVQEIETSEEIMKTLGESST